jgi:hypothetical protein
VYKNHGNVWLKLRGHWSGPESGVQYAHKEQVIQSTILQFIHYNGRSYRGISNIGWGYHVFLGWFVWFTLQCLHRSIGITVSSHFNCHVNIVTKHVQKGRIHASATVVNFTSLQNMCRRGVYMLPLLSWILRSLSFLLLVAVLFKYLWLLNNL